MLIICPSCSTAYLIELQNLGAAGRQVRCARCRTVWLATAGSAVPATLESQAGFGPGDTRGDPPVAARPPGEDAAASEDEDFSDWATAGETVDAADPVAVADAPSLVPSADETSPADTRSDGSDIETIVARRAAPVRRAGGRWQLKLARPGLPAVILMLMVALAALITWRSTVVRLLPQSAALFSAIGFPVNLRGLSFENLHSFQEFQDGMTVLVVEGTIVNVTRSAAEVPRLRFALRNAMGQEVYAWTALPTRSILGPQESLPFRTRLASPPSDGRDVVVRFFTRYDLVSRLR